MHSKSSFRVKEKGEHKRKDLKKSKEKASFFYSPQSPKAAAAGSITAKSCGS